MGGPDPIVHIQGDDVSQLIMEPYAQTCMSLRSFSLLLVHLFLSEIQN